MRNGDRYGKFILDIHMDIQSILVYVKTIECLHDDVISDVCHLMHEVMKWRLTKNCSECSGCDGIT